MAVEISTTVSLNFVNPIFPNPFPISPPDTSAFTEGQCGFYTIKDLTGSSAIYPVPLGGTVLTGTTLAEPRGFQNFIGMSTSGFVGLTMESTHPASQFVKEYYTSTLYYSTSANSNQSNVFASTLVIGSFNITQLQSKLTTVPVIGVSSITLRDVASNNPSTFFFSSQSLYLGKNAIKPNVDLNYDIQVIAPGTPWTPAQIPDLHVWFDGKDLSTMYADTSYSRTISTGEEVAVWVDKSVNQFSTFKNPVERTFTYVNDASGLYILNGNTGGYMDTNLTISISSFTMAFVSDAYPTGGYAFGSIYDVPNPTDYFFFDANSNAGYSMPYMNVGGYQPYFSQYGATPATVAPPIRRHAYISLYDRPAISTFITRIDGLNVQSCNLDVPPGKAEISTIGFGWNSTYGDLIFYNRWLEEPELQKLEGYLMWKYNVQNLLSPDHPYAANPP